MHFFEIKLSVILRGFFLFFEGKDPIHTLELPLFFPNFRMKFKFVWLMQPISFQDLTKRLYQPLSFGQNFTLAMSCCYH